MTHKQASVTRLTAQGRRKIEVKREAWQSRWEQALGDVEVKELHAATLVLERLGKMLEDAPAAGPCEAARPGAQLGSKSPQ